MGQKLFQNGTKSGHNCDRFCFKLGHESDKIGHNVICFTLKCDRSCHNGTEIASKWDKTCAKLWQICQFVHKCERFCCKMGQVDTIMTEIEHNCDRN